MTVSRGDIAQGVKVKRGGQVVPVAFVVKVSKCCDLLRFQFF